jgi:ATP-binding cassette subfamily C (CFTR/MRP) protein 4
LKASGKGGKAGPLARRNSIAKETNLPVLHNISMQMKQSGLYMVVGPVGCGKTSLLHALMGEIEKTSGDISVYGKVAYVEQEPYIFSGKVIDNIVFGNKWDPVKFNRAIHYAQLGKDMQQMSHGAETVIGERGINVSGGQKARISLARALYQDADIYLLDDPLSAVDPEVAQNLFNKCVTGFLKDKIVVLVTH